MTTPPDFLYFDLGNVLLKFDHARMLRQMADAAGVTVEAIRIALMPSGDPAQGDPQWDLEAGRLGVSDYYEQLCEKIRCRPPRDKLWEAASDIFAPIEPSMRLLERLHGGGHRLGLLSNTNAVHWDWFFGGRYPTLDEVFEVRLGSFQVRAMKPDPQIYWTAIERAGVAAERVFFTDDRQENVDGAAACGIDAVLFTGTEQLENDLRDRGIEC